MGRPSKNNIQHKFAERANRHADLNRMIELINNPTGSMYIEKAKALNGLSNIMGLANRYNNIFGMQNRSTNFLGNMIANSQRDYLQFNMYGDIFTEIYGGIDVAEEHKIELIEPPKIVVLDQALKVGRIIKSIYDDNSQLYKVHPRNFEEMIAELLAERGLKVSLTKQTRDGGFDILAIEETGITVNKYLVECKRNRADRPVDVGVVKQLRTTILDNNANKGILFTSSYFSTEAEKMRKKHEYILDFKNGENIIEWIRAYINKNRGL